MSFEQYQYLGSIGALAGALLMQTACASEADDDTVCGRVVVVDQTSQALTLAGLVAVDGIYTGCSGRADDDPWSIAITGGTAGGLNHAPLTVILNNTACALTLTDLVTDAATDVTRPASTPIPLGATYVTGAVASFGVAPILFYANALINPANFSGNFVVTIRFSDNPTLATGGAQASFAVATSTATAMGVPAPNTTLNFASFALMTDFNDVVTSATGTVALTPGAVLGQTYVLLEVAGLMTYANIDAAFLGGSPAAVPATIAAADFMLVGDDLTGAAQVRTLIIANTVGGVASYQVFEISFTEAP
jgi:hypothetical protein